MQQIVDLHIHSRFSRACSRDLTLENIDAVCQKKGVDIVATGDFTYPDWFKSINEDLEEIGKSGLYKLRTREDDKVKFILSTELALIYTKNDKCRRIHVMVMAPNLKAVRELNNYLDKKYNIRSDGRPILGMSLEELCELCFSINQRFLIFPAHIWTPWFAVFGSKSGFDSMEEAFGKYVNQIYAYETGLSSDPEMNWRLSALDNLTILSNSDAHSLPNIAREANVFELATLSYDEIYDVIKNKNRKNAKNKSYLNYTIEFYPEEGMYHLDGHRDCKVCMMPKETEKNKGICPVCKKPLVIGVMNRIDSLADRPIGFKLKSSPGFIKLVELDKIIAEVLGLKSRKAKKVLLEYNNLLNKLGSELNILIHEPLENISKVATLPLIAKGIEQVRKGELIIDPGFDGQYGTIKIFKEEEKKKQAKLF